jgi:hypothetical protein
MQVEWPRRCRGTPKVDSGQKHAGMTGCRVEWIPAKTMPE